MLHIQIDGQSLSTGQSQRVLIDPFSSDTVNSGPVLVGLAASQVLTVGASGFSAWSILFENTGTGGQIGIGFANTVTIANAPALLDPGDVVGIQWSNYGVWAIASLANTALRAFATRTN